jgi:hypothetical protein
MPRPIPAHLGPTKTTNRIARHIRQPHCAQTLPHSPQSARTLLRAQTPSIASSSGGAHARTAPRDHPAGSPGGPPLSRPGAQPPELADALGLSLSTLLRLLTAPHVAAHIDAARDLAETRLRFYEAAVRAEAIETLRDLATDPAVAHGERRRAAAAIRSSGATRSAPRRRRSSPRAPRQSTPAPASHGAPPARKGVSPSSVALPGERPTPATPPDAQSHLTRCVGLSAPCHRDGRLRGHLGASNSPRRHHAISPEELAARILEALHAGGTAPHGAPPARKGVSPSSVAPPREQSPPRSIAPHECSPAARQPALARPRAPRSPTETRADS